MPFPQYTLNDVRVKLCDYYHRDFDDFDEMFH